MGAEHHRLLIRSDAFHIGVLFQPTYSFMERVVEVLPTGIESNRSSTSLLDDFVVNIYLPQLEEKTSFLFHQAVTGTKFWWSENHGILLTNIAKAPDAFHVDPIALKFSPQPLLKATTQLMALINSLCAMLRTTPFHKENYARLILSVVIQFYQRCSDRFYSIVSSGEPSVGEPRLRTAAKWAQHSDVNACLSEMLDGVCYIFLSHELHGSWIHIRSCPKKDKESFVPRKHVLNRVSLEIVKLTKQTYSERLETFHSWAACITVWYRFSLSSGYRFLNFSLLLDLVCEDLHRPQGHGWNHIAKYPIYPAITSFAAHILWRAFEAPFDKRDGTVRRCTHVDWFLLTSFQQTLWCPSENIWAIGRDNTFYHSLWYTLSHYSLSQRGHALCEIIYFFGCATKIT